MGSGSSDVTAVDVPSGQTSEAENLKLRAQLMRELESLIHDELLTQSEAAELLGIHQSHVSDLVRGKIDRFSIDMLVKLLAKTGRQVEITVKRQPAQALPETF